MTSFPKTKEIFVLYYYCLVLLLYCIVNHLSGSGREHEVSGCCEDIRGDGDFIDGRDAMRHVRGLGADGRRQIVRNLINVNCKRETGEFNRKRVNY